VGTAEDWGIRELCVSEDPSTCDHEHVTLWGTDPVLGYLADAIERNGIKRGGIQYDNPVE
jgi:hypothetical protein